MELDATTFALEVVNFLVLLWLLQRFAYRPIQAALDARAQAAAAQALQLDERRTALDADAAALASARQALAAERGAAEQALADEIAGQRQQRLDALDRELAAERDKAAARLALERARAEAQGERELRQRAARFVADYLARLASPAVEAEVIALFLADLAEQGAAAQAALRGGGAAADAPGVDVATAHAPPTALREQVEARLAALIGPPAQADGFRIDWRIEPTLLAGICVHLPGHQLEASLRRGIDAFAADAG